MLSLIEMSNDYRDQWNRNWQFGTGLVSLTRSTTAVLRRHSARFPQRCPLREVPLRTKVPLYAGTYLTNLKCSCLSVPVITSIVWSTTFRLRRSPDYHCTFGTGLRWRSHPKICGYRYFIHHYTWRGKWVPSIQQLYNYTTLYLFINIYILFCFVRCCLACHVRLFMFLFK
jgi:hypothetical protein